jgi:hypothetical protein
MTNIEHVLTYICGFGAADAKTIADQCSCGIYDWSVGRPGEPVPEEIVSQALLRAVDGHVSTLPAEEQRRLEDAVRGLHETFSEPDGLIVAV